MFWRSSGEISPEKKAGTTLGLRGWLLLRRMLNREWKKPSGLETKREGGIVWMKPLSYFCIFNPFLSLFFAWLPRVCAFDQWQPLLQPHACWLLSQQGIPRGSLTVASMCLRDPYHQNSLACGSRCIIWPSESKLWLLFLGSFSF